MNPGGIVLMLSHFLTVSLNIYRKELTWKVHHKTYSSIIFLSVFVMHSTNITSKAKEMFIDVL